MFLSLSADRTEGFGPLEALPQPEEPAEYDVAGERRGRFDRGGREIDIALQDEV